MYKENTCTMKEYITKIKIFFSISFLYIKLIDIIPPGVSEMAEGTMEGQSVGLESHTLGRMSFGKDPQTKKVIAFIIFGNYSIDSTEYFVTLRNNKRVCMLPASWNDVPGILIYFLFRGKTRNLLYVAL